MANFLALMMSALVKFPANFLTSPIALIASNFLTLSTTVTLSLSRFSARRTISTMANFSTEMNSTRKFCRAFLTAVPLLLRASYHFFRTFVAATRCLNHLWTWWARSWMTQNLASMSAVVNQILFTDISTRMRQIPRMVWWIAYFGTETVVITRNFGRLISLSTLRTVKFDQDFLLRNELS